MKQIDRSHRSRMDSEHKTTVMEFLDEQTGLSFRVHRHIYAPDTWLVSCAGLCDKVNLYTDNYNEAVQKAAEYVASLAKQQTEKLTSFTAAIDAMRTEGKSR